MAKKHYTGYDKKKKKIRNRNMNKSYVATLLVHRTQKGSRMSIAERFVKFLIYLALRIVIRPSKWKEPKKNYEIIDRTYKRIMSSDFIFIPSSIAFYLVMGFIPILALVMFLTTIPGINVLVDYESVAGILGRFIPGIGGFIEDIINLEINSGFEVVGIIVTLFSLLVSAWIASGGLAKLIYTQSYIYEYKFVGGYWMNRIKGVFIVLSIALGLTISLVINISITNWIETWDIAGWLKETFTYIFLIIGLLVVTFIGFSALFKFSPRYKIRLRHILPGAMVAALPTTLFLAFFGAITSLWSYGSYGALGVIMYFGMSSLIISIFLFMGIISNASYFSTFVNEPLSKKRTVSKK